MRTHVFQVPDRDLQALVTIYDDGRATLAFRPGYGSWGPPIQSMSDTFERTYCAQHDLYDCPFAHRIEEGA